MTEMTPEEKRRRKWEFRWYAFCDVVFTIVIIVTFIAWVYVNIIDPRGDF